MRTKSLRIAVAIFLLAVGGVAGSFWQAHRTSSSASSHGIQRADEKKWPLTREIVSRSLQTHIFRSNKLRRNSEDEIVWRWLEESIGGYPQNWVRLEISENETYGVVLYPPTTLDSTTLAHHNKELTEKGLPELREGKRYLPIEIYQGDIVCPNWTGLVDLEEAKLVYFEGQSG